MKIYHSKQINNRYMKIKFAFSGVTMTVRGTQEELDRIAYHVKQITGVVETIGVETPPPTRPVRKRSPAARVVNMEKQAALFPDFSVASIAETEGRTIANEPIGDQDPLGPSNEPPKMVESPAAENARKKSTGITEIKNAVISTADIHPTAFYSSDKTRAFVYARWSALLLFIERGMNPEAIAVSLRRPVAFVWSSTWKAKKALAGNPDFIKFHKRVLKQLASK